MCRLNPWILFYDLPFFVSESLVFVFYEGIRFELANRSPYTYQIVDDIRAPAKHIWLRNMIQKSLRLADQRGFTEITFVVKRTGKCIHDIFWGLMRSCIIWDFGDATELWNGNYITSELPEIDAICGIHYVQFLWTKLLLYRQIKCHNYFFYISFQSVAPELTHYMS